jgi:small-conductance mechanosensitive channel
VAREVLRRVEGEIPGFEPYLRYHTFGEHGIRFTVVLRVKEYTYRHRLIHEFIKELHRRYGEEGIEIPFPVRTVYVRRE